MKKLKLTQILSSLVGIVFLISGIGKSLAVYQFSHILTLYGFDFLRYFAPVIILFEVALGLALFFLFRLKQTSACALCFVGGLSVVYLYGYFFKEITDCGCFGYFSFLNLPPLLTLTRNLILICILLYIFFKSNIPVKPVNKSEIMISICIFCMVCFATGYTYTDNNNNTENDSELYSIEEKNISVDDSSLSDFITFHKDSTYLVFAFSYSCPYCYNSVENLKQYEASGIADKVMALSYTVNTATMENFNNIFHPNFPIKNVSPRQLFKLTNQFPVLYYIENNIIKMEISGMLPCGYILQQEMKKDLN